MAGYCPIHSLLSFEQIFKLKPPRERLEPHHHWWETRHFRLHRELGAGLLQARVGGSESMWLATQGSPPSAASQRESRKDQVKLRGLSVAW